MSPSEPGDSAPGGSARRFIVPIFTLAAGAAGLFAGSQLGEPTGGLAVAAMLATIGVIVVAAWILFGPGPDILTAAGLDAFRAELDRARRHRRTFALARLALAHDAGVVAGASGASGIDLATLELVGSSLRITDHAWLEDGDVIVLLPESDRETAEALAERLHAAAPDRFTGRPSFAVFPDDGLTSGALLDALERGVRGDARPAPLVRTTVEAAIPVQQDTQAATSGTEVG